MDFVDTKIAIDRYTRINSPLGELILAGHAQALCGAWFHDQKYVPTEAQLAHWRLLPSDPILKQTERWFAAYFQGAMGADMPALDPKGTDFQRQVWLELLQISAGSQQSYGGLATRLGKGNAAARAVGSAVGRNPISVMIPCHRVLGASGALTGYAGGLLRKQDLLTREGLARV
jgi:methylated-DNA-[protein]-cysteine S-methyltransferase